MANLAIVGSHSTNGVAKIHSQLLRTHTVKDLAELFPERFNNKTNGVTPRRWLQLANPQLSAAITQAIGDGWTIDLDALSGLTRQADDAEFRKAVREAWHQQKISFANWLKKYTGHLVDPQSIYDCHVKRIHEYKRQLLNVLRIVVLYNRLREKPNLEVAPRTFFFAGKAAPAYRLAQFIIKLIHNIAGTIPAAAIIARRLQGGFLPGDSGCRRESVRPT